MRKIAPTVLVVATLPLVACGRTSSLQPDQVIPTQSVSNSTAGSPSAPGTTRSTADKPEIDPTYANGTTVYMIGPHMVVDARDTMPNAYAHAEELYLLVYPQPSTPQPGAGPITLLSGYQPQCNPCFHPGLPPDFVYHDHVITGAPGMGKNGTAGEYKGPWKIILLMYNPDYVGMSSFTPITSASDIDDAESPLKHVFLQINPKGANQYEIDTGNLLICPTVSNHG